MHTHGDRCCACSDCAHFGVLLSERPLAIKPSTTLWHADGDGRISVADLDASLAHVAVCCPKTRCVYRCRSKVAHNLLAKAANSAGGDGSVGRWVGRVLSWQGGSATRHGYVY